MKVARAIPDSENATALVFDPPLLFHEEPIEIARDNRGPAAFAGFDEPSVSYTDVFTDNNQSNNGDDYIHRDSLSEKVGVIHR